MWRPIKTGFIVYTSIKEQNSNKNTKAHMLEPRVMADFYYLLDNKELFTSSSQFITIKTLCKSDKHIKKQKQIV